jgi:sec-independent protein translocase protein TatB
MFDVAPTELLLVAVVALLVIGPKDLPRAMRVVGTWVGRARGLARHFRSGIDEMIRQSELEEMEKKWREENERIMREFPTLADPVALPDHSSETGPAAPGMTALPSPDAAAAAPVIAEGATDLSNWHAAATPEPIPATPADTPGEAQYSLLPSEPAAPAPPAAPPVADHGTDDAGGAGGKPPLP